MTKTVRQLLAEATEYRVLAETFEGDAMPHALLETARALESLAQDLEDPGVDYTRLV